MASLTARLDAAAEGPAGDAAAPSPLRAAEMALIRLCYAADLPSPSDALKALQNGGGVRRQRLAAPPPRGGGGGGGAARRAAQP